MPTASLIFAPMFLLRLNKNTTFYKHTYNYIIIITNYCDKVKAFTKEKARYRFDSASGMFYKNRENNALTTQHSKNPTAVGSRAATAVSFRLFVSFFTVRSVVEQGQ